jgi:hypothetical protein
MEQLYFCLVLLFARCSMFCLPVLTGMNVLFQASLPLPRLLFPKISYAKQTLIIGMVGTVMETEIMPVKAVNEDTSFGAYVNKYMDVLLVEGWHKLYVHALLE